MFGRVNMDEFAMGSSTEKFIRTTSNPELDHVIGGSSGGSAASVVADHAIGYRWVQIPVVRFGSRLLLWLCGLKPTYEELP